MSLQSIKGIGPDTEQSLKAAFGIETEDDLRAALGDPELRKQITESDAVQASARDLSQWERQLSGPASEAPTTRSPRTARRQDPRDRLHAVAAEIAKDANEWHRNALDEIAEELIEFVITGRGVGIENLFGQVSHVLDRSLFNRLFAALRETHRGE